MRTVLGYLSRCDGSAILTQGDTTILGGVYGPVEVKQQDVLIDRACVRVHYRPIVGLPSVHDRLYERIIRNICETAIFTTLYPRAGIIVVVQEMDNGGGLLSGAINAAHLALLDSGIAMRHLIAALTCILTKDGDLIVEPQLEQQMQAVATFDLVFESKNKDIVSSHTSGKFTMDDYESVVEVCRVASENVFKYVRGVINDKISGIKS